MSRYWIDDTKTFEEFRNKNDGISNIRIGVTHNDKQEATKKIKDLSQDDINKFTLSYILALDKMLQDKKYKLDGKKKSKKRSLRKKSKKRSSRRKSKKN